MNCSNCKNPVQPNSNDCEWCGIVIDCFQNQENNPDLDNKLKELIRARKMFEAVKIKMDNSQMNLKEAKNYIDNLASKMK